jgi:hypothetical protein
VRNFPKTSKWKSFAINPNTSNLHFTKFRTTPRARQYSRESCGAGVYAFVALDADRCGRDPPCSVILDVWNDACPQLHAQQRTMLALVLMVGVVIDDGRSSCLRNILPLY